MWLAWFIVYSDLPPLGYFWINVKSSSLQIQLTIHDDVTYESPASLVWKHLRMYYLCLCFHCGGGRLIKWVLINIDQYQSESFWLVVRSLIFKNTAKIQFISNFKFSLITGIVPVPQCTPIEMIIIASWVGYLSNLHHGGQSEAGIFHCDWHDKLALGQPY